MGFLDSSGLMEVSLDRRVENIEKRIGTIVAMEEKLDKVIRDNEAFRKEILVLNSENAKLMKQKLELENKNALLGKHCQELTAKIAVMERQLKEGEEKSKQRDTRLEEVKKNNEEAHNNFREIIKQQEKEKSELAQREIVRVLQQEETMVRNIAEKKKCVVVSGLREDNIRNWQERKNKEEEKIKTLLNKILEEENAFGEVEEYMRLGKYEEGKSRAMKITLKSQIAAEHLLRNAWKLKNSQETNMIYVRRNMSQEERAKMKEMVTEVRERNEARTEEEKKKFFWKIRNDKVWKWWTKERE